MCQKSVQTLLKITLSGWPLGSHLVIICRSSYEKLPKLGKVGVGSNIAQNTHLASGKSYLFIIFPMSPEKLTKNEIRESHYVPLFGFIYSYFATIYHFGPDWAFFIYIFQYLALFTYIYPHLALFILIWLYLPIIALIWPYMPYSPYIYIFLYWDCTSVQNFNQSDN